MRFSIKGHLCSRNKPKRHMETKQIYLAPQAETVHLSHECALMQTSSLIENYGEWITNEWTD